MSMAQFPAFPSTPNLPRTSPPTTQSQMNTPSSVASHRACCENGRPILTDPHTGQTVCSCQYPPGLVTYPRAALPPGLESVYSASAYAAAVSQGFVTLGAEGSAFYSPLGNSPYDLKESAEAWRTLAAAQPGFPYDPMAMYPYGPGKNATRENTNTLKAWLYEHRKNPYPTKGEKIMLAIITKMTLTQVSTWFANARRRLKKENKMTWSPRNKPGGNDDDDDDDSKDKAESDEENARGKSPKDEKKSCDREGQLSSDVVEGSSPCSTMRTVHMYDTPPDSTHMSRARLSNTSEHNMRCPGEFASIHLPSESSPSFLGVPLATRVYGDAIPAGCLTSPAGSVGSVTDTSKRPDSLCSNSNDSVLSDVNCPYADPNLDGLRPKIWSLAQVATSDPGYSSHCHNSMLVNPISNSSPRNISSISQSTGNNSLPGSGGLSLTSGHPNPGFTPGHSRHDSFQSSSSSASSSLSPFAPSPTVPPLPPTMPQWGSMYGPPPQSLGSHNGKPHCTGPQLPQNLPLMLPSVHMVPASLNSMPNLHSSSPPACYMKAQGQLPAYYSS